MERNSPPPGKSFVLRAAFAIDDAHLTPLDALRNDVDRLPALWVKPVTESEIRCIQALSKGRPDFPFFLKQLYGLYWGCIKALKRFGLRFRAAVRAGLIPGIGCDDFVEGNTKLYRLTFPRPQ